MITDSNFEKASEGYEKALSETAKAQEEMDKAKDVMESTALHVELQLINQAGGDPKKLGATEADRKRAYEAGKLSSNAYEQARNHYFSARGDYRYHHGMLRLFELKLQFYIATAKDQ